MWDGKVIYGFDAPGTRDGATPGEAPSFSSIAGPPMNQRLQCTHVHPVPDSLEVYCTVLGQSETCKHPTLLENVPFVRASLVPLAMPLLTLMVLEGLGSNSDSQCSHHCSYFRPGSCQIASDLGEFLPLAIMTSFTHASF